MRARGTRPILIFVAMLVALAVPATVVAQQAPPPQGSAEIHELYVHPSDTQAGGHPDGHLFFRFCDALPHVVNATNTSPIVITTAEPHGLSSFDRITVRGVRGNLGANQIAGQSAQAIVLSPTSFELRQFVFQFPGQPPVTGAPI